MSDCPIILQNVEVGRPDGFRYLLREWQGIVEVLIWDIWEFLAMICVGCIEVIQSVNLWVKVDHLHLGMISACPWESGWISRKA